MNEIQSTVLNLLPSKRKTTPSGWISVNAVCCHHNGQRKDNRSRGGILITPTGGFNWHCFNCGFKAGWSPGKLLSANTKKLFNWFGLAEADIGKLNLVALRLKDDQPLGFNDAVPLDLKTIELPENCLPINTWLEHGLQDQDLLKVIEYVVEERSMNWEWYNWHWSPDPGFRDRVIIPFYQDKKIVGYTGRKISAGKPKYLTVSQPGYVFNIDAQTHNKKYVIVNEGQFDAIAIDGVGIMTNEPNSTQIARINSLGKEVICVPDRDRAGIGLINSAIANDWSVSLPPWDRQVKDVADAVKNYGRLYTLATILHYRVQGEIKLTLLKKQLEAINEQNQL